ncbi:MAG: SAM-dependent methyltransferase, partial [Bacteroidota bacterium]
ALAAELAQSATQAATSPAQPPTTPVQAVPQIQWQEIEGFKRFSESKIWELQRRFFEEKGAEAWTEGIVPHYITSNAYIARTYARMATAFLNAQTEAPVFVELGAGSGQFSFHFLKALQKAAPEAEFTYVITDFTESNLDFCRAHPALEPFVKADVLKMAHFDMCAPTSLPGLERPRPIFLIANYLFDSIPQDLFAVHEGEVYSTEARLLSDAPEPNVDHPDLLKALRFEYQERRLEAEFYAESYLNRVLERYAREYYHAEILFPFQGIKALQWFLKQSDGNLMLLSSDKGYVTADEVAHRRYPGLVMHGSFSLPVNYHAMGWYAAEMQGQLLVPAHTGDSIQTCGFVWGNDAQKSQLAIAFEEYADDFGPDDFFALKRSVEENMGRFRLESLIAYLRLCDYDPKALLRSMPHIRKKVGDMNNDLRTKFHAVVQRVLENDYGLKGSTDWGMVIGK